MVCQTLVPVVVVGELFVILLIIWSFHMKMGKVTLLSGKVNIILGIIIKLLLFMFESRHHIALFTKSSLLKRMRQC